MDDGTRDQRRDRRQIEAGPIAAQGGAVAAGVAASTVVASLLARPAVRSSRHRRRRIARLRGGAQRDQVSGRAARDEAEYAAASSTLMVALP
jgi:hypothetical protein